VSVDDDDDDDDDDPRMKGTWRRVSCNMKKRRGWDTDMTVQCSYETNAKQQNYMHITG